jgi:hypothetical protein
MTYDEFRQVAMAFLTELLKADSKKEAQAHVVQAALAIALSVDPRVNESKR